MPVDLFAGIYARDYAAATGWYAGCWARNQSSFQSETEAISHRSRWQ